MLIHIAHRGNANRNQNKYYHVSTKMAKIKRLTMTGDSEDLEQWGPADTPSGL